MNLLRPLRNQHWGYRIGGFVPSLVIERRPSLRFGLCASTLIASLLLGGGTRGGFLSDAVLELLSIPALLAALSSLLVLPWNKASRSARWALMLCLGIVLLPLVQLFPLPPWMWTRLPHREEMVAIFALLGRGLPWLPVSVAPADTWLSALSLLPPIAIFLCVFQLNYQERRTLSLIFFGVGMIEAFVGLLQVAQGPSSPWRFFAFTNRNEAVGFFANRNHFAALLYVLVPFGAAWATDAAFAMGSWRDRRRLETASVALLTASALALIVLIAAELITRSRAGLGLMIVAIFAAFALPLADRRRAAGLTPVKLLVASIILAIMLLSQFALYRVLVRFSVDALADARIVFARNTIAAAMAYLPFGSGFGTFVSVYPTFERPQDTLANIYANHAHNDFLEVALEGGVGAMILMGLFAGWLALRCKQIWREPPPSLHAIDVLLARAATIGIVLLMAHSLVDYPLRTGAIMGVLALSCAFLLEPFHGDRRLMSAVLVEQRRDVRQGIPALQPPEPNGVPDPASKRWPPAEQKEDGRAEPARRTGERWGEDIEWPQAWRSAREQEPDDKRAPEPTDK